MIFCDLFIDTNYNCHFRAYDYLWHCVKTNLNNSYCEDDTIEAHLTFSLMEATNYLYSYWNCSSKCCTQEVDPSAGGTSHIFPDEDHQLSVQ